MHPLTVTTEIKGKAQRTVHRERESEGIKTGPNDEGMRGGCGTEFEGFWQRKRLFGQLGRTGSSVPLFPGKCRDSIPPSDGVVRTNIHWKVYGKRDIHQQTTPLPMYWVLHLNGMLY